MNNSVLDHFHVLGLQCKKDAQNNILEKRLPNTSHQMRSRKITSRSKKFGEKRV